MAIGSEATPTSEGLPGAPDVVEPSLQIRGYRQGYAFKSFLSVSEYVVRFPLFNGGMSTPMELVNVDRGDAVAGLLHWIDGDQHWLIFVRQFRLPTTIDSATKAPNLHHSGEILELMAGNRNLNEPWIEALRRETKEETGFDIAYYDHIATFYPSPGACSEQIHLYYARIVEPNFADVDEIFGLSGQAARRKRSLGVEGEDIVLERYSPREFLAMVEARQIIDAKCLAAAEWMRRDKPRAMFGI